MTSSKNTAWIAGTGVLAVLILVASYFLLLAPKRAEASDTVTQAAGVEQNNVTLAAETERLKAQFATLGEQRAQLAAIQSELPDSSQVPTLIRQFTAFAGATGLTVTEIAPGSLTPYVAPGTSADAAAGTTMGTGSGISALPVSVTVSGSFAATELFVKNLQADMHRYMLVDSVDLTREDGALSTTVSGRIFVLAAAATAATGTSAGTTPAADSTTTTETTSASTSTGTVN
ncbi:hypothetical protein [Kineococcus rhizosphaerae]|uniref:Type IV pilus assembly protein PilO n=1 Tax=Kineococcus rhizosphaerae TaxID=559628 RepID=A0A2T0R9T1_9ACTN|nr:hypothetical protein [Kineococcus rhizosphaerae]PRY17913.1 type IV pilus assembly protein PilO [Kineococcus rhizosphaerae]